MKTGIRMAVAMVAAVSSGAMAAPFSVSSEDMHDGQALARKHWFAGFGCTGGNVSPQLAWKNAPAGTRSFAVTVRDPDAPTGSGWWHWTVVNIASSVFRCPLAREIKTALHCRAERYRAATILAMPVSAAPVRRREINRIATALRYGRWMSLRCRWMPGPAGRWSAICYTAMLSPAYS
ncbi:phosphatidylethanolamine-binding protein [Klebsiella variicola]|nr:phosphatidylethanolamine-binding protein [Klebsiella variicola]